MKWKWEVDDQTTVELRTTIGGHETVYVNGREIFSKRNLFKFKSDLEFKLPQYREGHIHLSHNGFHVDVSLHVDGKLHLPEGMDLDIKCPSCEVKNKPNDRFCASCGTVLPTPEIVDRQHKVKEAVKTIRVLSVLFVIFGVILFFVQKSNYDTSLEKLASMNAADVYPQQFNGKSYTVGELRTQVNIEKYSLLILNVFLALIMLGLSFWAKKSPLGALIVATSIYVAIIVLNAAVDPSTLAQGLIMKIFIIGMLLKGIKSSLELKAVHAPG